MYTGIPIWIFSGRRTLTISTVRISTIPILPPVFVSLSFSISVLLRVDNDRSIHFSITQQGMRGSTSHLPYPSRDTYPKLSAMNITFESGSP